MLERVILLVAAGSIGSGPLATLDGATAVAVTDAQLLPLVKDRKPFDLLYWDRAAFDSLRATESPVFVAEVIRDRRDRFSAAPLAGGTDWTASRLKLALVFAAGDRTLASMIDDVIAVAAGLLHGDAVENLGSQRLLDAVLVEDGGALSMLAAMGEDRALADALAPFRPVPAMEAAARAQAALSTAMGHPAQPATDITASAKRMIWSVPGGAETEQLLTLLELPSARWRNGLVIAADPSLTATLEASGEKVTRLHRLVAAYSADTETLSAPELDRVLEALAAGDARAQAPATRAALADALFSTLTWRAAARKALGTRQPDVSGLLARQIATLAPFAVEAIGISESEAARALTARDRRHPFVAALSEAEETLRLMKAATSAQYPDAALDRLIGKLADMRARAEGSPGN